MSHPFDAAISLAATGEHRFAGATHPAYANMVGPYGGATCAVLLNAALLHPQRLGEPIALTVNYAAPLADGSFEIEARPVRTNRSTQHWSMALAQQGAVVATSSAVFAARRETWSAPEATPPAGMPPAITLPVSPVDSRPRWVQQYDMRFAEDESPALFSGTERTDSETRLWVRDEPPRPLDFPRLRGLWCSPGAPAPSHRWRDVSEPQKPRNLRAASGAGAMRREERDAHSTVTLFARFLGLSTSVPLAQAV